MVVARRPWRAWAWLVAALVLAGGAVVLLSTYTPYPEAVRLVGFALGAGWLGYIEGQMGRSRW